ncbi:hypothetical protein M8J77_000753 [Diaphorina citri]|nr:hypothetical protein M8J77_000753 [Diaphorina citri]
MVTFTVPLSLNILIPGWSNQTPKLNFDDVMGELGPEFRRLPCAKCPKGRRSYPDTEHRRCFTSVISDLTGTGVTKPTLRAHR